jgi:molecular chaperone DnaK (HSP70)
MASLSKWSVGIANARGDFVVVIPRGSLLPARRCVTVTTAADSQPDMKLSVYMGEGKTAEENYPLSAIRLECRGDCLAGQQQVKLTFNVYEHSVMNIGVRYAENEAEQEISIIPVTGLSDEEMARLREIINKNIAESVPQEVCVGTALDVVPLKAV